MTFNISVKSRLGAILVTLLIISLIGLLDYISGTELSFSAFYLIPVLYMAIHENATQTIVLLTAFLTAFVWFIADFFIRTYSYEIIPYWNAFVRFAVLVVVGKLALNLNMKHKKLEEANKKLEHLNEEKNKLIGVAAHDLRNPIGNIFSFSELLLTILPKKDISSSVEIAEYIKKLSSSTLVMLEKLLDISKIESGIIELNLKQQDYIAFVTKYVTLNQMLAKQKNISIRIESDAKELIFPFDEHYLSEVLNNLITNAIKYSHPQSEIVVRISDSNNETVKTEVIDKGEGIKKEEQAGLFRYFQRTSTRPTAGEKSTGLGLAIAKKIVLEHNGTIGLESKRKKGSIFYFELPKLAG